MIFGASLSLRDMFFFCDTFFRRSCIPFVSLFWLPALVSQKCQRFFLPCLFVDTSWLGWRG